MDQATRDSDYFLCRSQRKSFLLFSVINFRYSRVIFYVKTHTHTQKFWLVRAVVIKEIRVIKFATVILNFFFFFLTSAIFIKKKKKKTEFEKVLLI